MSTDGTFQGGSYSLDATYNDTGDTLCRVAASLQVLRDDCEDTGGKGHVEQTVCLLATLLKFLEVLVQGEERVIFVILARDIGAELAKVLQHLLHILCGGLDVRLDPLEELLMVHLGSGIANNPDVLGQELIAVLQRWISTVVGDIISKSRRALTRPNRAGNYTRLVSFWSIAVGGQ